MTLSLFSFYKGIDDFDHLPGQTATCTPHNFLQGRAAHSDAREDRQ